MAGEWVWLREDAVLAVHEEQLAQHGGGTGIRDHGLLESTLARPRNLAVYGEPDLADLAAAYAYGIARNHPFVDGNKRTAAVAAILFLWANEAETNIAEAELVTVILALAAGELGEEELAGWLRERIG
jgi:death-on-curing protein